MSFETFLSDVVGIADLIASDELKRKWVDKAEGITSAYDFSELAEQLLGDLSIEEELHTFNVELTAAGALEPLQSFLNAFLKVDVTVANNRSLSDPAALLESEEWRALRRAAQRVVTLPYSAAYREMD